MLRPGKTASAIPAHELAVVELEAVFEHASEARKAFEDLVLVPNKTVVAPGVAREHRVWPPPAISEVEQALTMLDRRR